MTAAYTLQAKTRDMEKATASDLREQGMIPAELYGHGKKNQHIVVDGFEFEKLWDEVGESNLVGLVVDGGKPLNILIKDVQLDSVTDKPNHVDFYIVKMDEKLHTEIPLIYTGVSKAVKELGGILVKSVDALTVVCLPGDLVPNFTVDISKLVELNDAITVGDLEIPDNIEVQMEASLAVCSVQPPKKVEEPIAEATEGEAAENGVSTGDAAKAEAKEGDTVSGEKEK